MRTSTKIALLFAGIWFIGKYCFFYFQLFQSTEKYPIQVMWNILCLLLAMSIGSLIEKRKEIRSESSALGDIKSILGIGMIYTLIVGGLIYIYYSKIDPAYNENQIAVIQESMEKLVDNPVELKKFKEARPEFEALSKEEILTKSAESIKPWYQASTVMTISLLGMLMLSVINSLVLTIIYRRLLFRQTN
jgi:hypothetical protein